MHRNSSPASEIIAVILHIKIFPCILQLVLFCNQIIFATCMTIIKPFPNQIFIIAIIIDRPLLCIHVIPLNRTPTVKVYGYCSQLHFQIQRSACYWNIEIFLDIIVSSLLLSPHRYINSVFFFYFRDT